MFKTGKGRLVAGVEAALGGQKVRQLLQLGAAEGGVEVGQAVVEAGLVVDIGPGVGQLGGGGQVLGAPGQVGVVGEDGAPAAGGDDLVAVEAEDAQPAAGASMAALVMAAEGFRGVFHQDEVVVVGQGQQAGEVAGVAEGVHRHQHAQRPAGVAVDPVAALGGGAVPQPVAQGLGVEAEGVAGAVGEMGRGTAVTHGIGGGDEGEGRDDDLIARQDAGQQQGDMEGGGAIDHGDGVARAGIGGQVRLEAIDILADGGDEGRGDAVLDITGFVADEARFVQLDRAGANGLAQGGDDGFGKGVHGLFCQMLTTRQKGRCWTGGIAAGRYRYAAQS